MLQAVEKPVGGNYGVSGYVVMSNLMRWGDYDDDFLTQYGGNMLAKEQEGVRNGARPEQIWGYHGGGLWPHLNTTGTDFGFDPMTGYMKALSNSPDAATEFFNSEFIAKDTEETPLHAATPTGTTRRSTSASPTSSTSSRSGSGCRRRTRRARTASPARTTCGRAGGGDDGPPGR
ncbi:hypothetical protein Shyd_47800 [Streptomyces hydrogenans]|uniref:Uncharacterized protein n=1 Tax=Streptomyces hydrogenans TaxID=1873719 RepID=A0ABQ3PEE9_9ACTN|nr:hypothetical protein [Streptomyces hydrogenans]GHI23409.1 hypothetical protein Shyd_47800 [Streptomyces hydrogenans]